MSRFVTCVAVVAALAYADFGRSQEADGIAYFEKRVRPILVQRCYSCHSESGGKQKGKLALDRRDRVMKGGVSGPALVSGKPEESLLIHAIRYEREDSKMPPSEPLPAREVAILVEWVRQGAAMPAADSKSAAVSIEEGKKHWAFQPLKKQMPPKAGATTSIDAWVVAGLAEQNLKPSAAASRRVLIRRLSFDLLGLPPTPEEIEAFEKDERPDAYERLVDRMLKSPHHGERWARFWLDLTRYCDVAEQWAEHKGPPHVYRDWVVAALNEDMPFDRFVRLQLAADRVADARPSDLAALGFLGLSPSYWKELNLDKDVIRAVVAEEWEEKITAVSSTFLGLSVACARCHDHKHDPVTAADYYALAGVFASTKTTDRAMVPAKDALRVQQARAEITKLEAKIKETQKAKTPEATKSADELKAQIEKIKKDNPELAIPLAPAVEDAAIQVLPEGATRTKIVYKSGEAQDVRVQKRGNPAQEGEVANRRFLEVLGAKPFRTGSGRADLAEAIVSDAAPLTARVIVNRVWRHHFGRGIVETPSDFGFQGDRPSHPEMLDDLAARFVEHGWSLRWLHREIVLSATYRQASAASDAQRKTDPDNRWLGRMTRRRLEAEAYRDAMLAVTGSLDRVIGGPARDLSDSGNVRRTLYGQVKRREIHDYLRLNDFPDPVTHSPSRLPTTTALQQLFVLNGPLVIAQANQFAKRLRTEVPSGDDSAMIQRAHQLAFGRAATEAQVRIALEHLQGRSGPAADEAWRTYCHALLASNEFQFVD